MKPMSWLAVFFRKCSSVQRHFSKRLNIVKQSADPQTYRVMKFNMAGGNDLLFRGHDLTPDSNVYDIGGFRGDWAAEIFLRYSPYITIFEPVPTFADQIAKRFADNAKISVNPFGLGGQDQTATLYSHDDRSSIYQQEGDPVQVRIRRISDYLRETRKKDVVDLMKINIEGAEYELLEDLIESDLISTVRMVQVQFHDFVDGADKRMHAIQNLLTETHELSLQHTFVWENWKIREDALKQPDDVIDQSIRGARQHESDAPNWSNRRKAG